jgi:hypothetical protein
MADEFMDAGIECKDMRFGEFINWNGFFHIHILLSFSFQFILPSIEMYRR